MNNCKIIYIVKVFFFKEDINLIVMEAVQGVSTL